MGHGGGLWLAIAALFLWCPGAIAQIESRPWNLSVRLAGSHDTNVPLAATDNSFGGNKATNVLALGIAGDYRFYRDTDWTAAATCAFVQTRNGDPALREFDLTTVSPGIVARRGFRLADRPAALSLVYAFRRDWLGGSGFDTGHVAGFDLGWRAMRSVSVGVFGSLAATDFDDDGADPALSSRDAVNYRGGLRGAIGFNRNRQAVQASLAYVKNDAEGLNFVFQGPAATLQAMSYVVGLWTVSAAASYARANYTNFADTPQRETTVTEYRLAISGPLTRRFAAELSFARSRYASNLAAFQAKRQNLTLGVAYSF